ncbi:transposase [Streptosporangium sp. NPDC023615]|uniref:transposase n=1 Tax=Streptosporangium sp. NPDC023615 TaxID=3154794 RepID=UPI00343A100F
MSPVVMKNHPSEFKADAVALVLSRPDRTITSIAQDLGVGRETPRLRVRAAQRAAGPG